MWSPPPCSCGEDALSLMSPWARFIPLARPRPRSAGIDTALMQVLWNGFLSVRKMRVFARRKLWKLRRNSSAESARATPRSGAGMWPLTYLEAMPNQENHLVSSVWLHVMETFSFACTKYVFGLRMCEDERRPLMNVDKHLEQKYSQEKWISELQVQLLL